MTEGHDEHCEAGTYDERWALQEYGRTCGCHARRPITIEEVKEKLRAGAEERRLAETNTTLPGRKR